MAVSVCGMAVGVSETTCSLWCFYCVLLFRTRGLSGPASNQSTQLKVSCTCFIGQIGPPLFVRGGLGGVGLGESGPLGQAGRACLHLATLCNTI